MTYPRLDTSLSFQDYILQCQQMITARRTDLANRTADEVKKIVLANSPFEYPAARQTIGALLIHGLLDSPFTYRELADTLSAAGIHTQSVLLQGHGTCSTDLLDVTYQEWMQAVHYALEDLRKKVDKVFMIGYSTGAALAITDIMQHSTVDGLVLCAPAIKLRPSIDVTVNWVNLTNKIMKDRRWIYQLEENDYVKYKSIALNGALQVAHLTDLVRSDAAKKTLTMPIMMVLSKDDETISSPDAIQYFSETTNDKNRLLLYTSEQETFKDKRIELRSSIYPELNIRHLSHSALMFSADNFHYGDHGDYQLASHTETNEYKDGAYNRIEVNASKLMAKYNLMKNPLRSLTYNPDFPQLAKDITQFILSCVAAEATPEST